MEETCNVCGMPKLTDIEIHKSKDTGKLYINFITWDDKVKATRGLWRSEEITEEDLKEIYRVLNRVIK